MKQCLIITFNISKPNGFLRGFIQKVAIEYSLEGTAQLVGPHKVRINACGKKENVDSFVDSIYGESSKSDIEEIEMEPLLQEKNFRGVFRVIE